MACMCIASVVIVDDYMDVRSKIMYIDVLDRYGLQHDYHARKRKCEWQLSLWCLILIYRSSMRISDQHDTKQKKVLP